MKHIIASVFLCMICLIIAPMAAAQTIPLPSVLAHYSFDETTGTTFADSGLGGTNATFIANYPIVPELADLPSMDFANVTTTGPVGNAARLGHIEIGTEAEEYNTLINIPYSASLPSAGDTFAASFWLSVDDWAEDNGIVASYKFNGLDWNFGVHGTSDSLLAYTSDGSIGSGGSSVWQVNSSTFTNEAYVHFVVQFSGTSGITNVFVNGASSTDAGATGGYYGNTSDSFLLGGRNNTNYSYSDCETRLDDVALIGGTVTQSQAAEIMSSGISAFVANNPSTDLLMHHTMDETAGNTAYDSSPAGNNASLLGCSSAVGLLPRDVSTASVTGVHGQAAQFAWARQEYAQVDSPANLACPGDDFTIAFWAKASDWDGTNALLASQNSNGIGYTIGLHDASNGLIIRSDFGTTQTAGFVLDTQMDDEFVHFAIVFDDEAGISKIYINGDLVTSNINNGWGLGDMDTATLATRLTNGNPVYPFDGALDDYAAILGELSESQIEQIMAVGVTSLLGSLPLPGDANGDGYVDETDAAALAANWLATSGVRWSKGDFNNDGIVNEVDATIMAANWSPAMSSSVPEPSMVVFAYMAIVTLLLVRRRHV